MALFFFGLAIPRERKLGLALFLFLTVGTVLTATLANTAGAEMRNVVAISRWVGFLAGFGLVTAWLLTEREPRGKSA